LEVNRDVRKEALSTIDTQQLVSFATLDGDQPRVRTVTVIHLKDRYFIAAHAQDDKVTQIGSNPKSEFCLLTKRKDGFYQLRIECSAQIVDDKNIKSHVYDEILWMKDYFKAPSDPAYSLIELYPVKILYKKPGRQALHIEL
jgi:uncharacterized pyridoxamine 5'-phosphate oxidase family protein